VCRWVVSKLNKWVERLLGWRVGGYVLRSLGGKWEDR
jgi:hypothetical protein